MRAEKVYESLEFERGGNPKKKLGLGIKSEEYIKARLRDNGFANKESLKEFWELFKMGFMDWTEEDISNHIISILDSCDPNVMAEYMDNELNNFFQYKKESEEWDD